MSCVLTEQKAPSLWRYNPTTGFWSLARGCTAETALMWLAVFQKDEPDVAFKLSPRRPKGKPKQ